MSRDRQRILKLAADAGYDEKSFGDLLNAVQKHLSSPDQSLWLRETSEEIERAILEDVVGDLVMMIHDMSWEECPCQQCGYMRDNIERIRRIHGEAQDGV